MYNPTVDIKQNRTNIIILVAISVLIGLINMFILIDSINQTISLILLFAYYSIIYICVAIEKNNEELIKDYEETLKSKDAQLDFLRKIIDKPKKKKKKRKK